MSQQQSGDSISNIVRAVTDVLILRNPVGTSIGMLCGVFLYETTRIFEQNIRRSLYIDTSRITVLYCVILGVLLPNFPAIFRRHHFDPAVEDALAFIRESKRKGKLTDAQVRLMYWSLYQKVLERATLDEATEKSVNELNDALP